MNDMRPSDPNHMAHSFKVLTTITNDGKIIQELHGSDFQTIMHCVIDTQKQQIIDALIALGWTPPGEEAAQTDDFLTIS